MPAHPKKKSLATALAALLTWCASAQLSPEAGHPQGTGLPHAADTVVDPRDGQRYATVTIGNLRWFRQNLNYATGQSVCYEDETISCGEWGRLYNQAEMKTVCPPGWRIPNRSDWNALKAAIGQWSIYALMDPTHWKNNGHASNATGLSLVPSGFKHRRKFHHQYMNASIWFHDPSEPGSNWHLHVDGMNNAEPWYFHDHEEEVYVRWFAVRCVSGSD